MFFRLRTNHPILLGFLFEYLTFTLCTGSTSSTTSSDAHLTSFTSTSDSTLTDARVQSPTTDNVSLIVPETTTSGNRLTSTRPNDTEEIPEYLQRCPSKVDCYKLGGDCITCDYSEACTHGQNLTTWCQPKPQIICEGAKNFSRWYTCEYCYQTAGWSHRCTQSTSCRVVSAPRDRYLANCTVLENTLCLGQRRFYKYLPCNWTSGKRWSTALILSITLGGFGADRFYLGLWREGIGKLFSFGGLGVWTLLDVILIATGYVGPADGSLYL